jgi:hypothetical protein
MGLTDIKIIDFSDSMKNMGMVYLKWLGDSHAIGS